MFLNRCIWTPTAGGTADFVVSAAALSGYRPVDCLGPLVANGGPYDYFAIGGTQHEEGSGVYTASTSTLTRDTIRNSSTGGAKINFTSPPTVFMGVLQASAAREVLQADRDFYVRTDGSDSNSGMLNSSVGAWLTLQHAWDVITHSLDLAGFEVRVNVGAGTFAGVELDGGWSGAGDVRFIGAGSSSTTISVGTGTGFHGNAFLKGNLYLSGIKFQGTSGTYIWWSGTGLIVLNGDLIFDTTTGVHLRCEGVNCSILASGSYTVGGASIHAYCNLGGFIQLESGTITVTGTPAWGSAFAQGSAASIRSVMTISGAATGIRYYFEKNMTVDVAGAGINYFPGDVPGFTLTGSQYA